jgi:hypothetical protein
MKISTCLLSSGLIFASIYTMIVGKYNQKTIKFIGTLDSIEQLEMYTRIQAERTVIYLQGQILGMLFAIFYLYYFRDSTNYSYCYFSLITFVITIAYYLLKQKNHKMNDYLKTQEQKEMWKESKQSMKTTYIFGFILGLIGYIILGKIVNYFLNKESTKFININK